MPTVMHLPYVEPARQPTAKHPSQSLSEHLVAFLSANNPKGYLADEVAVVDSPFMASLKALSEVTSIYEDNFKRKVRGMKNKAGGSIKHSRVLEASSRALGYRDYSTMRAARQWDDVKKRFYYVNKIESLK